MDDKLTLFVKASNYTSSSEMRPKQIGECYLCQRVRMIVRLKDLFKNGKLVEVFVHPPNKQTDRLFKQLDATMLPVLLDHGIEYDDAEEIEAHLENPKHNFVPFLESQDKEVNKLAHERSPISDFAKWAKSDVKDSPKHGVKIARFLHDIDDRLRQNAEKGHFLDGNTLKLPDCILLPKLYHMQVAAAYMCSVRDPEPVDIFEKFTYLSNYIREAIKSTVFKETKPPVDEIQYKWKNYDRKKSEKSIKELTEF